jgi:DNA-binding NarL/FixJ family response regulator
MITGPTTERDDRLLTGMGSSQPIRVVIIDDHAVFADGLAALLRTHDDLTVAGIAGSVKEATTLVARSCPHVVLMDYELGDGTGVEATNRVLEQCPDTRVVMLTSYSDDAVLVAAIEAGCTGFITKHRAGREVVDAVRAAAAGEAMITPSLLARLLPRFRREPAREASSLTGRELEVLELLADGRSNQAIADDLGVSLNTVRNHVQNLLTKLHAHSRLEAVAAGVRQGLIERRGPAA